ncbi:MAG: hypothetical protein J6B60_00530 [Clostridia bacterium]|nr:hypothetical protein [Clostridia bacterium]
MDIFENGFENETEKSFRLLSWSAYKYLYANAKNLELPEYKIYKELEIYFVDKLLQKNSRGGYMDKLSVVTTLAQAEYNYIPYKNIDANVLNTYIKEFNDKKHLLYPSKRVFDEIYENFQNKKEIFH